MGYLPYRESELVTWVTAFNDYVGNAPTTIGLTAGQATALNTLVQGFLTAYLTANTPSTRTTATIEAKNLAKNAMLNGTNGVRQLVGIIQKFPGTTNIQRADLGITIPDPEPTPVPQPEMWPEIDLKPPVVRTVKLRLHNEKVLGRQGRPDGVTGATIFSYVGPLPPPLDQPQLWKFEMNTGATTAEITFPSTVAAGATVWITASWFNQRGEQGPAAPPVNTNLPGTLQQAA